VTPQRIYGRQRVDAQSKKVLDEGITVAADAFRGWAKDSDAHRGRPQSP